MEEIRILIVEDNPGDIRLLQETLKVNTKVNFTINACARLSESINYLTDHKVDVILLDLSLPDSHGLETLRMINSNFPNIPILLLTGLDDETTAIEAMRNGAQDYLVKGTVDTSLLTKAIIYAIQRKAIETKITSDKNQLEVTLSSIADGVITTDANGKITLMNTVAENITGWSQKDSIGKDFNEIFHVINDQTNTRYESLAQIAINTKKSAYLPINTILIAKNGDEKYIEDDATPIKDQSGKITGVVIVFRDIGEKRKSQAEIIKIQKLEALGVLAGGISHDFNNVLTAILNNVAYAKIQVKDNSELLEVLLDIEKTTLKSKSLTQQLLTFAKGGAPVKETASITELIKNIITFSLRGTNHTYSIHAPNETWPIDLDIGQFNQAINNIVNNAKEAMPDGGNIDIAINNIKNDTPVVEIRIKDSGIGIPERFIHKIFDPYFTTKQEGSGLGLAITYSIVKRHHGDIKVESFPGKGTLFIITLPASKNIQINLPHNEPVKKFTTGKGKILIMDDEQMILNAMSKLLKSLGYDVVATKNGTEAVAAYKEALSTKQPFSAVIMDLVIPGGMGGKEAIRNILEIDPMVKAIVSSAYSQDPVMSAPKTYGFKAVVAKPYDIATFTQILAQVIEETA